jgi:aminoglycoside phosphotransferase (APT) family kinase protein
VRTAPGAILRRMDGAGEDARRRAVAEAFAIPGRWLGSAPLRTGWINETLVAVFEEGGRPVRYVQQRINRAVFPEPERVMENVARVTAHVLAKLEREGAPERERRALCLVPARDGAPCWRDPAGETWRTWRYVEGASSRDVVGTPAEAGAAAEAFARFQAQVADLPGPRLHETIPGYQDARRRFEQLLAAVRADAAGRLAGCRVEVDFVTAREPMVDRLNDLRAVGALPERITHGDTKINNVLLDDRTGEALCVIDLDTVMPGFAVYDFGDLARTAATRAAEDERDLARVRVDPELFAAIAAGWLRGAGDALAPAERAELVFAARLLPLVIGMRFLADHLAGDRYFRCDRPGHNLDRARAQLALAADFERRAGELEERIGASA